MYVKGYGVFFVIGGIVVVKVERLLKINLNKLTEYAITIFGG